MSKFITLTNITNNTCKEVTLNIRYIISLEASSTGTIIELSNSNIYNKVMIVKESIKDILNQIQV